MTKSAGYTTYRVELTQRASRDLEYLYELVHAETAPLAARWYNGLEKAIGTLERFPYRCTVAPEARGSRRPFRQLLYGRRPHVYRALYEIDESKKVVRVLTIRHGARDEDISLL